MVSLYDELARTLMHDIMRDAALALDTLISRDSVRIWCPSGSLMAPYDLNIQCTASQPSRPS